MTIRLGQIPYLNCEPFFAFLDGFTLTPLAPRALGRAVADGLLDGGPLSLVDYLRLADRLAPLPFGIATRGAAQSVFLFSPRPPDGLDGAVISVTDETSTSVEILRVLLDQRYRVRPRAWVGPGEAADAVLLIGDRALRTLKSRHGWAHVTDLGVEWVAWTGLPCVFARWGVRAAVPEAERRALSRALDEALTRGLAALPAIAARRGDTGLRPAEVEEYLRGFVYRIGPEEERAIAELERRRALLPPLAL
jgi:chorismate dehydratase